MKYFIHVALVVVLAVFWQTQIANAEPLFGVVVGGGALAVAKTLVVGGVLLFAKGLVGGAAIANRNRNRSGGRRFRGKRSVDDQELALYTNLLTEVYNAWSEIDRDSECFQRWVCSVSSDKKAHPKETSLLNFGVETAFDEFLPLHLRAFKSGVRVATRFGEFSSAAQCKELFKCPFDEKVLEQAIDKLP